MEENKYYTPEIEEFHIGFEFEVFPDRNEGNIPIKHTFISLGEFGFDDIEDLVKGSRVKYLDKEDIESFGFKDEFNQDIYELYGKYPEGASGTPNKIKYTLMPLAIPNKYEIRCNHPSMNFGHFMGFIKNKSELKRLLKQLGIIE